VYKILIIDGHPRADSLCASLAEEVRRGAEEAGNDAVLLAVRDLDFDPTPGGALEACIMEARELIRTARHVCFVYPTWWGTMPALLKGFVDRVFAAGFAFEELPEGGWRGLLSPRTASLLTTMDTPPWIYRWLVGKPGHRALGGATLGFCGCEVVSIRECGPVKDSTAEHRADWLMRARVHGRNIRRRYCESWWWKARQWARVVRFQFYPFPWAACTAGALLAAWQTGRSLQIGPYILGCLAMALAEFATVLRNEQADLESDRNNRNAGPFTGGSRVLVENRLGFADLQSGLRVALGAIAVCLLVLGIVYAKWTGVGVGLAAVVLGLAYTTQPVKLAYRGLGEIDVAVTHSFVVLLAGYACQANTLLDSLPWLLAAPICLAVLPSITLAGFPDRQADAQAGKRTLAVRFGARTGAGVAGGSAIAAVLLAGVIDWSGAAGNLLDSILWFAVPHALVLCLLLRRNFQKLERGGRIDLLLVAALSYMVWFALIPLVRLLGQ
jgi:1,4-dihydroxy-2-naphthoate octaprenyltransferase